MGWISLLTFLSINFLLISQADAQGGSGNNNCSKLFRGLRRAGASLAGRLEIPVDSEFPKFKLRLKFNRAIHHLSVRQLTAKNVGGRREFEVNPSELQQDGILRINALLRLGNLFSPTPRLIGVLYNGKVICGDNVFDDAILVELKTTTVRSIRFTNTTTKSPKEQDEDDEVFN